MTRMSIAFNLKVKVWLTMLCYMRSVSHLKDPCHLHTCPSHTEANEKVQRHLEVQMEVNMVLRRGAFAVSVECVGQYGTATAAWQKLC